MSLRLRGWQRWLLLALAALLALVAVGYGALAAATLRSHLARAVIWGESGRGRLRPFLRPQDRGRADLVRITDPSTGQDVGVWNDRQHDGHNIPAPSNPPRRLQAP